MDVLYIRKCLMIMFLQGRERQRRISGEKEKTEGIKRAAKTGVLNNYLIYN